MYERTQKGKLWVVAVLVGIFGLGGAALASASGEDVSTALYLSVIVSDLAIIGLVMTFNRLQVEVTPGAVVMSFGWGWPRKTIQRSDIVAHHVVRNSPLLGWGIRWFKGGTMWNVWGLDAVELQLDTGRKFRIGTDDPAGLDAALSR